MNLRQGFDWFNEHLRWVGLASILVAALGPSPSHESGFTFTLPIGLLLFLVESHDGLKILAALLAIYTCLSFTLFSTLSIIWGSLRSAPRAQ